jgi:hypothetical protein|nr:MAG TPA: hypothetical protein [Caudoviricetes sp.]
MIELELLNKITKRVQSGEEIEALEKEMLLGTLKSVLSYYKQKEDISMLDVIIVLYERLTGVKSDKNVERKRFIEHYSAKGLVSLLDELEQKGKRQKEKNVDDFYIQDTRDFYKIVANKIKERGII